MNKNEKEVLDYLNRTYYIKPIVFNWLDSSNEVLKSVDLPTGVIKRIIAYNADQEAEHETLGFVVRLGKALILPSMWDASGDMNNLEFVPFPSAVPVSINLNYPVTQGITLEVEVNQLPPTSGCTVIIEFEPREIYRAIAGSPTVQGIFEFVERFTK